MRSSLFLLATVATLTQAQTRPPVRAANDSAQAGDSARAGGVPASALAAFRFRLIGPAFTSGRIADLAIHPNKKIWYAAVAAGGVQAGALGLSLA